MLCRNCGFENPSGFKFCGECGTPIAKDSEELKPHKKHKDEAERRQLTVMFCDLVGSTALSEKLDPEDMRQVMQEYQEACAKVITRFEGYIAKYLGDGILVYFGYPKAHEDDAHRAVRAGLEIVWTMSSASGSQPSARTIHELPLPNNRLQEPTQVRVGIHTGLVVAGEMGIKEKRETMAIVGETPNIAARLQDLAEPNAVLISSSTHKLVEGYFECNDLGPQKLKGISSPITVYRAVKESNVRSRLEIAVSGGLTPLIGREEEVELLLERWQRVKESMGQVVLLSGEAGIGKSRLVQVMKDRIKNDSHVTIQNRCSAYYHNSALYPIIDHLERLLEFKRQDSHQQKLHKLEKTIEMYDFPRQDMVPLFASLLSIPLNHQYPPLNLTPERQKQKTTEALIAWLLEEAEKQPVLYIVEDLHWVDPSTLEYLTLLIEQVATARIFALFTFRPDFTPPWPMRSHVKQMMLGRLMGEHAQLMVEGVAGNKPLPADVVQNIVVKTDGVPLYVEEFTKMVLESGMLKEKKDHYVLAGPLPQLGIPSTLQDSFMARLDRIDGGEICGIAATLGREFTYDLLQAASSFDDETLKSELTRLVEAQLLFQRGILPKAKYTFKHALIQDAAYQSLLKSKRRQYHQRIAEVLENQFPETCETQPELLAHHYTMSGLSSQAVFYWKKAGERAKHLSAHVEAVGHLTKGLELLNNLPENPERVRLELDLQISLGPSLMATKGWAAPEAEKAYARALELYERAGETAQILPVLVGLYAYNLLRTEFQTAIELGGQYLSSARDRSDSNVLGVAHLLLGMPYFHIGNFTLCHKHLNQSVNLYDAEQKCYHIFHIGYDPRVTCRSYLAHTLWMLGYPDQATNWGNETLTLAKDLSHPFSLAVALDYVSLLHQFRGEANAALRYAEAAISLCTEHGFEYYSAWATIIRGWALTEQGNINEGIKQMKEGLANLHATGANLRRPYYLGLLAEAYSKAEQVDGGLSLLDEALTLSNDRKECWWDAELFRIKGELLLHTYGEHHAASEECFRRAVEISGSQRARSLELRAAISLSRLLQDQGKKVQAKRILEVTYGGFKEGFDTKDPKEAKALLEKL